MSTELVAILHTLNAVLNQRHGGESPTLKLGADGALEEVSTSGGQAVGVIDGPHFEARTLHLNPGDTLLLYTDGLTEARVGPGPRRFDDDGALLDFVARTAPSSPGTLIAALSGLLDELSDGVQDDVALLAIGACRRSGHI